MRRSSGGVPVEQQDHVREAFHLAEADVQGHQGGVELDHHRSPLGDALLLNLPQAVEHRRPAARRQGVGDLPADPAGEAHAVQEHVGLGMGDVLPHGPVGDLKQWVVGRIGFSPMAPCSRSVSNSAKDRAASSPKLPSSANL